MAMLAQPGTLDPSFGNAGYIQTTAKGSQYSVSVAKQAFTNPDGTLSFVLQVFDKGMIARRLSNGTLDATYHNNGYSDMVSMYLGSAAMQSDGKIVLAGAPNQTSGIMLARYNIDGTLDPTFGQGGITITTIANSWFLNTIVITPSGNIVVAGNSSPNGHTEFTLARYSSSGALDATFGSQGIVTTDFNGLPTSIISLALQPDGMIIAGGTVPTNGNGDFALARYTANGSLDPTFNSTGIVTSDFGSLDILNSVAVSSDGRIYAGGLSSDGVAYNHFRIARYNPDGSPDLSFNGGSVFPAAGNSNDNLFAMKIQADGKIVAAGTTTPASGNQDLQLVRVNTDGTIDNGFGNSGFTYGDINSAQDDVSFLTFDSQGNILTGGDNVDFSKMEGYISYSCFRFTSAGSPDIGFGNGGKFIDYFPSYTFDYRSMFMQSNGKLIAMSGSNAQADNSLYLNGFNGDGSVDNTFGQSGRLFLNPAAAGFFQPDGRVLAVSYNGNGDFNLSRYKLDGSLDATFGVSGNVITHFSGNEFASLAAFQSDNKIIVAGTSSDNNGGSACIIARYNPDGSLDLSFGGGNGFVKIRVDNQASPSQVAVTPDGKIVLGITGLVFPPDFSYFDFDIIIARLNADGSLDQGFANQGILLHHRSTGDFMGALQVLSNDKIAFTDLLAAGNEGYTSSLQMLNVDGTSDLTFGNSGSVTCDPGSLLIQPDGKILIPGRRPDNFGNLNFTLTRLNTNGSPDPSFGNNGQTVLALASLDNRLGFPLISSNSLFVSGEGLNKDGSSVGIVAKFRLDAVSTISCPGNQLVTTDTNACTAHVKNIDPTVTPAGSAFTYQLKGATTGSGQGSATGKIFNKGVTTVTYSVVSDPTKTCSFTVTIQDKQLPVISNLRASPTTLWPPDHKLVDVTVSYQGSDNCGLGDTQLFVTSNEPAQSNEKNDQSPDWQILDSNHIRLRAERLETGHGRTYTIMVTATDLSGNRTTAPIFVNVPKSMGTPDCNLTLTAAPNPSHNNFQVTLKSACNDKINLRLIDNNGVVLMSMTNLTAPQTLTIGNNLTTGIYYLEAAQAGNIKSIKLVKQ